MKKVNIVLCVVLMLFSLYVYSGAAYGAEVQPITEIEKSAFVFHPKLVGKYDPPTGWNGNDLYIIAPGSDADAVGKILSVICAEYEGAQCPENVSAETVYPEDVLIIGISSGSQKTHNEIAEMVRAIESLMY